MARADRLLARARGLDPLAADRLTAGFLAGLAVLEFAGTRHPVPAAVIGPLGCGSVAVRRRAAVLSIVVIAVTSVLIQLTDPGVSQGSQALAACLCFYMLGRSGSRWPRTIIDTALFGLGVATIAVTPPQPAGRVAVAWLTFVGVPYVAGLTVASRRSLTHELGVNAERARLEQETRARGLHARDPSQFSAQRATSRSWARRVMAWRR